VARLLAAAVAPPTPRELAGQASVLAELRTVTRPRRAAAPVRPARPRRRRAVLVVVVVAGALATGGVAAATGHLPDPVREAARGVLGPGGGQPAVSPSPAPGAPGSGTAGSGGGPGGSPSTVAPGRRTGPAAAGPAAGPALDGLCKALQGGNGGEQGGKLDATAFQKLARAAGGVDSVPAFCEGLLAADAKTPKDPKPKAPPGDPRRGQGPGGLPATGGGNGSGNGRGSDSTPPAASSPGRR
jgi:hypothetical protein